MTGTRWLYESDLPRRLLLGLAVVGVAVAAGAFIADAGDAKPDPVPFEQATTFSMPNEDRLALEERGLSVPRVEVFYSQYNYVVGYEGLARAIDTLQQPQHDQQFGQPLAVYVSDYAGTDASVTDDGYLDVEREPGWVSADEAWFVYNSSARTTVSEMVVPFSTASAAEAFAQRHGGEVHSWSTVKSADVEMADATAVRENVPKLRASADERTAAVESHLDRPVRTVVGQDTATVQAAIDTAPPNSTVRVPEGTYSEHLTIDKPLTLRGTATIRGNNTGTVIHVTSDDVAIDGLSITGIGDQTQAEDASGSGEWDDVVDVAYGHSDAGIRVSNASQVSVHNVTIDTPTSGVLFRDAEGGVVDGLRVNGTAEPFDGFMGVISIRSPLVVQNSVFDGGRDGVYLHRAHETVVRNSTFRENRFGVHFMYTSDTLVADSVAREQTAAGITIMTSPARNAVVGNDIRYTSDGIIPGGSRTYVADNVVAYNERGIMAGSAQSLYEHNVIYGNGIGMRAGSTLPSNVVRENDFVANEEHATAGIGPLRIWTDGGVGNYWEGAYGDRSGDSLDRSYSPTDPTEKQLHRVDGTVTLAESPAARALAEIRATSPGLRRGDVVDLAPRFEPHAPEVVAAVADNEDDLSGGDESE
ncbi:NosD domain-containing protein [Halovenus salina]|uniref:NosD domain-containing protein n=1 Tax=Halovenus salina TaxID=1510225 RepID=UPI002260D3C9|nr:NosD domain-containing protein [Halovenus salina]